MSEKKDKQELSALKSKVAALLQSGQIDKDSAQNWFKLTRGYLEEYDDLMRRYEQEEAEARAKGKDKYAEQLRKEADALL